MCVVSSEILAGVYASEKFWVTFKMMANDDRTSTINPKLEVFQQNFFSFR
jgi:hypothetical protein